jgi:hypothetical protein
MSHQPDIASDWHAGIYKQTPVSADHCARIIRAIYPCEARRDRSLPPALPTSAIEVTKYESSQVALDLKAYPAQSMGSYRKPCASGISFILSVDRLSARRGIPDQAERH